jgi:hypothetical protein
MRLRRSRILAFVVFSPLSAALVFQNRFSRFSRQKTFPFRPMPMKPGTFRSLACTIQHWVGHVPSTWLLAMRGNRPMQRATRKDLHHWRTALGINYITYAMSH